MNAVDLPELARMRDELRRNPDDRHLARRFNELAVRHRCEIDDMSLKVLLGPCNATSLMRDSFCPWATVVSFNFENSGDVPEDHIAVPFEDADIGWILDRLPTGFEIDLIMLVQPEWSRIPRNIVQAEVPVVMYVQDHRLGIPKLLALADIATCAAWDRNGIEQLNSIGLPTLFAAGNGYVPAWHRGDVEDVRPVDVAFLGGMDRAELFPDYLDRDRTVVELAKLSDEANLVISDKLDESSMGPNYLATLSSTKILVCYTETHRLHPSICEAMAAGAVVMVNRGAMELESRFVDGENIVYYSRHDLLDGIRQLLADSSKRIRIARNGQNIVNQVGSFARQAGAAVKALSEPQAVWRGGLTNATDIDLRSGILAAFDQSMFHAGQDFQRAVAVGSGDRRVALNNLGVVEVLSTGDVSGSHKTEILARATTHFGEAAGPGQDRPMPIYHLCLVEWLAGRPPAIDLIERLQAMLRNPIDDSIDKFELLLPPEMTTAVAYHLRHSRLFSEWSNLIWQVTGKELAARFCRLACWRVWGLRRDLLAKLGSKSEAIEAAERAHYFFPEDPRAALLYGALALDSGDFESAAPALKAAVEYRPLHLKARILYGAVLEVLGETRALEELTSESEPLSKISDAWANSPSAQD